MKTQSKFLNLNLADYIKGLLTAVFTAVVTVVYQSVQAGLLTFDFKVMATTAILATAGYLLKNLTTNSNGQPMKKEQITDNKGEGEK